MIREDLEMLTQTAAGTVMGEIMRQFWVPAVRAARLEADGAPVRVRLLGENYVAFRATDGRVGFFDEGCPHRCTSLALARNEDNALTCIFHGWKIDVSGKVVDVPSEPPERRNEFAVKVRVNHYPVREAAGLVWVWLGRGEQAAFPDFAFTALAHDQVRAMSARLNCNWLQALELLLDPARFELSSRTLESVSDNPPVIEVERTDYGFRGAALTELPDGEHHARIIQWLMPGFTLIPAVSGHLELAACAVPIDDTQCLLWLIFFSPKGPIASDTLGAQGILARDPDNFAAGVGASESFWREGQPHASSRSLLDDVAFPQAQGPIQNLADQRLCSSDQMVMEARQFLSEALRAYQEGRPVPGLGAPVQYAKLHAGAGVLEPGDDWRLFSR